MSNILFTSDWHIGHKKILDFCDRGVESLDEMHAKLVMEYNRLATDDTVGYFLGDMSFSPKVCKSVMSQLKGQKILVRGNHDQKPTTMKKHGFDVVVEELDVMLLGKRLKMSHFPYRPTFFSDIDLPMWKRLVFGIEDSVRYFTRRPVDRGGWLLHGHTHSAEKIKNKMIHVGVDAWNMQPVTLRQIEQLIGRGR
jgi:calcineurin-like phosphoesterase family protein